MPRSALLYLEDMQVSMERIALYCAGMDFDSFCFNQLVIDGVVRNLEVIGEAAKKVPLLVQQAHPALPWSQMYWMRNRISHEYFGLDLATVWRIATEHLPQNYPDLLRVVEAERNRLP